MLPLSLKANDLVIRENSASDWVLESSFQALFFDALAPLSLGLTTSIRQSLLLDASTHVEQMISEDEFVSRSLRQLCIFNMNANGDA